MRIAITGAAVACALFGATSALAQDAGTQEASANARNFELAPTAYVQFDLRAFPDWDVEPGTGRMSRDTVEFRRIRAGLDGRWRKVTFEFSVDPMDDDGVFVKDAYAQIRLSDALRLRAGQFKIPGTRDYDVSARNLDFLERTPLTTSLAVGRDIGARVDGRVGILRYEAGVFAGDGIGRDDRSGLIGAGRVTFRINNDLEFGASLSDAHTDGVDSDPPNGPDLRATSGYRFADGVYVNGQRLRLGADVEWSPGRWRFVAETLRLRDQRLEQGLDFEDLPDAIGTGFSVSAVRRLRARSNATGGSWLLGAFAHRPIDAGIRYDFVSLDDAGGTDAPESVRARATNIRAKAAHTVTLGSTWVLTNWLRMLGNAGVERYSETRSAPEAGRSGNYFTFGARLQVEWR